ncbi:MAG: flagellar basal body rod protein FlgB [Clostridiales bacterium]|jgi:flagellar basal-body rod protein FlgB|nr:flagellar basal body rod protein FlgB [Clostridiales bacterium]
MLLDKINRSTLVQEKTLDAAWLRNEVLAHNIANVDTPTYNRKDVDFEKYLQNALDPGLDDVIVHRRHSFRFDDDGGLDSVGARVTEDYNTLAMRIDGNNVDVDEEMAQMAKNTIKYNMVTQNVNGKFSKIKHVITEGRR